MSNTNKKPTIIDNFNDILNVLKENGLLTDERKAFLEKRIEVTAKKNASGVNGEKKLTKLQTENENIKTTILAEMEQDKSYTITEMIKSLAVCSILSQNKVNALVKQLKDEGKVIRTENKGKAYFTKVKVVGE